MLQLAMLILAGVMIAGGVRALLGINETLRRRGLPDERARAVGIGLIAAALALAALAMFVLPGMGGGGGG